MLIFYYYLKLSLRCLLIFQISSLKRNHAHNSKKEDAQHNQTVVYNVYVYSKNSRLKQAHQIRITFNCRTIKPDNEGLQTKETKLKKQRGGYSIDIRAVRQDSSMFENLNITTLHTVLDARFNYQVEERKKFGVEKTCEVAKYQRFQLIVKLCTA